MKNKFKYKRKRYIAENGKQKKKGMGREWGKGVGSQSGWCTPVWRESMVSLLVLSRVCARCFFVWDLVASILPMALRRWTLPPRTAEALTSRPSPTARTSNWPTGCSPALLPANRQRDALSIVFQAKSKGPVALWSGLMTPTRYWERNTERATRTRVIRATRKKKIIKIEATDVDAILIKRI